MSFDWKDLKAGDSPPPLSEAGKGPAPLERVRESETDRRVGIALCIVGLLWVGLLLISPLLPPLPMYAQESCFALPDVPLVVPLCVVAAKVAPIVVPIITPPPAPPNPEASTIGPAWSTSEMNSAKSMADIR